MTTRKTRRPLAMVAGALGLSGLLAATLAANTPPPGGDPGGRGPGRFGRSLGLSDEQKTQIRGILRAHATEIEAQMKAAKESRRALRVAMDAQPADETQIRSRALALGEVRADGAVLRARIRSEIWPILTAEQQEKARELRSLKGRRERRRMDALERWLRQDG
jgi:Spy/CpxP family protein refolding chaperone